MKRIKLNISALLILPLLAGIISLNCIPGPEPLLRVGTNVWPGYECFYLARSLGYYNGTPIRLVEYPSTTEVMRAFRNGTIEAAALTMDEALILVGQKQELRIVLVTDISNGADAILSRRGIETMQGLKGLRVGVETSALGAYVITRALESAGMSVNDIEVVSLSISEQERAFKNGRVDAVVTFEPVRSRLISSGANLLFDSTMIPGEIVDVLAVRKDVLAGRRNSLNSLLSGWFRALSYLKRQPAEAARIMAPREGVTPEQFQESIKGIHIPDLKENERMLGRAEGSIHGGIKRLSEIMVKKELLPEDPDITNLLHDGPIKEVVH